MPTKPILAFAAILGGLAALSALVGGPGSRESGSAIPATDGITGAERPSPVLDPADRRALREPIPAEQAHEAPEGVPADRPKLESRPALWVPPNPSNAELLDVLEGRVVAYADRDPEEISLMPHFGSLGEFDHQTRQTAESMGLDYDQIAFEWMDARDGYLLAAAEYLDLFVDEAQAAVATDHWLDENPNQLSPDEDPLVVMQTRPRLLHSFSIQGGGRATGVDLTVENCPRMGIHGDRAEELGQRMIEVASRHGLLR